MKLRRFLLPVLISTLASMALMMLSALPVGACGPYFPHIPVPSYFAQAKPVHHTDSYKSENLCLWRDLTDQSIPLSDINEIVYKVKESDLYEEWQNEDNMFYAFINNTGSNDILRFLRLAKRLEERRAEASSPWFYPTNPDIDPADPYRDIIEELDRYKGGRLKDRYGLQIVRALFASKKYEDCIARYETCFAEFPDSNLFKRMARAYVSGCLTHLGRVEEANLNFAAIGDLNSLTDVDAIEYMAEHNPDAPELMSFIACDNYVDSDSTRRDHLLKVGKQVLKRGNATYVGDWAFLVAYLTGDRKYLDLSLESKFSNDDLADHARAFRLVLDAKEGNRATLLEDLKWLKSKCVPTSKQCGHWEDILRNVVLGHWLPRMMEDKEYSKAVFLTGFAEGFVWDYAFKDENPDEEPYYWLHPDGVKFNLYDYSSLMFRLMTSLEPLDLIKVYDDFESDDELLKYCKHYIRSDRDYFYEAAGTEALRRGQYENATILLSLVSPGYEETLNTYPYLKRDPFAARPFGVYCGFEWEDGYAERKAAAEKLEAQTKGFLPEFEPGWKAEMIPSLKNAKLTFARRMLDLKNRIATEKDVNKKALAKIEFAIGRYNAVNRCWALTRYYDGCVPMLFNPDFNPYGIIESEEFGFIVIPDEFVEEPANEYARELLDAMSMITDDETRAKAELMLNRQKSVVCNYPRTAAAAIVRAGCDNWRNWL